MAVLQCITFDSYNTYFIFHYILINWSVCTGISRPVLSDSSRQTIFYVKKLVKNFKDCHNISFFFSNLFVFLVNFFRRFHSTTGVIFKGSCLRSYNRYVHDSPCFIPNPRLLFVSHLSHSLTVSMNLNVLWFRFIITINILIGNLNFGFYVLILHRFFYGYYVYVCMHICICLYVL